MREYGLDWNKSKIFIIINPTIKENRYEVQMYNKSA